MAHPPSVVLDKQSIAHRTEAQFELYGMMLAFA